MRTLDWRWLAVVLAACRADSDSPKIESTDGNLTLSLVNPTESDPLEGVDALRVEVWADGTMVHSDEAAWPQDSVQFSGVSSLGIVRFALYGLSDGEVKSAGRTPEILVPADIETEIPLLFLPVNQALVVQEASMAPLLDSTSYGLTDGRAAVVGGADGSSMPSDLLQIFDPYSGTVSTSLLPRAVAQTEQVWLSDRAVLVAGGWTTATKKSKAGTSRFAEVRSLEVDSGSPDDGAVDSGSSNTDTGKTGPADTGSGDTGEAAVDSGLVISDVALVLELQLGQVEALSPMLAPRLGHCVASLGNDKALILGGSSDSGVPPAELLRRSTDGTWQFSVQSLDTLDAQQVDGCIGTDADTVFVHGLGAENTGYLSLSSEEALFTPLLTEKPNVVHSRLVKLPDDHLWLAGGQSPAPRSEPTDQTWLLTPEGQFEVSVPLAQPQLNPRLTSWLDPGWVVLGCGVGSTTEHTVNAVELHQPTEAASLAPIELNTPRQRCAISVMRDGAILVSGGQQRNVPTDSLEIIVPYPP